MIIKAKPLPAWVYIFLGAWLCRFLEWKFKIRIKDIPIKRGHSYLLMSNHTGFWDGMWSMYIAYKVLLKQEPSLKGLYIMSLKKQVQKRPWLRYLGSFSVEPGTESVKESLSYAADILSEPGNVFLFYPQSMLESSYVRYLDLKPGVREILHETKGPCQLIWVSNFTEYFESLQPQLTCCLLDAGIASDFDFERFRQDVNRHHLAAMKKQFRYTVEPD